MTICSSLITRLVHVRALVLLCGSMSACSYIQVAVQPASSTVEPGGTAEFAVSVTRVGNISDVDLAVPSQPDVVATLIPPRLEALQDTAMLSVESATTAAIGARTFEIQTMPTARSNRLDGRPTTATIVVGPCGARWVWQYGTPEIDAAAVTLDSTSNAYVTVALDRGVLVAKLLANGDTDWHLASPFQNASGRDALGSAQPDGTIYFVGTVRRSNDFYVRVMKYGTDRALLWSTDIGPARGVSLSDDLRVTDYAVDAGAAPGITLVGTTSGSFGGSAGDPQGTNSDGWMAKLGENGTLLWHEQTSTFESDGFDQVVVEPTGAIFVRGTRARAAFVRRYRAGLVEVWTRDVPFDSPFIDAGGLAVSSQEEVYALLAGASASAGHDPQLLKLDFSNRLVWATHLAGNGIELPYAVKPIESTGEVLILGTHVTGPVTASGVRLARLNSATGVIVASRAIDTSGDIRAFSMAIDGISNLYLAGITTSSLGAMSAGGLDAWVAQLDYSAARCWQ